MLKVNYNHENDSKTRKPHRVGQNNRGKRSKTEFFKDLKKGKKRGKVLPE